MVPPLKDDPMEAAGAVHGEAFGLKSDTSSSKTSPNDDLNIAFSHVQLYVDKVENIKTYKELENSLNQFIKLSAKDDSEEGGLNGNGAASRRDLWQSITKTHSLSSGASDFIPQNRDVVKQMIVGFGFRVTGFRFATKENNANTRSILVTSKDSNGVQVIVTARDDNATARASDDYRHFDAAYMDTFYGVHSNRQGIAVLGFQVNDVERIREQYQRDHPKLIHAFRRYERDCIKVLEVYAYYKAENPGVREKQADVGTLIRFIEALEKTACASCLLPGLTQIDATFDNTSQAAYCDHWVSNVFSRTEFLNTLKDTLGFTPKVDFNAGVVAAGEAQIESTVTGNNSQFLSVDKEEALKDQSQVYLPINNSLSDVGHVHGFLQEIGQGIQHVASRVDNLVAFVQRCNQFREATGEGFTFLRIPRSYYGVLTLSHLIESAGITVELARKVLEICEKRNVVAIDGAVDLQMTDGSLGAILDSDLNVTEYEEPFHDKREAIIGSILRSRYKNLFPLLQKHISENSYLGIVRNQILVDVQGEDILYQIFTCNILQREAGDEAPFFEFIQRVCSECKGKNGCPAKIKPGCGGFGIRNFLTLFLSIEVGKAMLEVSEANRCGDEQRGIYAQNRIDCFTSQLNDSNPILTEISDAMTMEGSCKLEMELAMSDGDTEGAAVWKEKMEAASERKQVGNSKLMECSARYNQLMRSLRKAAE